MLLSETFFLAAGMFTAAAAHPFVTYPLSLSLLKRLKVTSVCASRREDIRPVRSLAVCVSAYNEEAVIEAKAANLLALREHAGVPVELLVYVDAASDRTAERLAPYADRIRVVIGEERRGKSSGMNRLVEMTDADVVVFSDANVMVEPDALARLLPYFGDSAVGCVCGHLIYTNGADSTTAAIGSAYWRAEETLKQGESETGNVIGADGSIFAIRRTLHRPVPEDIIDDFYLSLSILCDGYRVVRAADVRAFETSTTESADEFRRKIRISCQSFNVHRLLRKRLATLPWLLRYKYVSHKLLRWLALPLLAVGGVFALLGLAAALGGAAALAGLVAGLGGLGLILHGRVGPLKRPREILLALTATALGVLRSLRGDRFQTWHPPVSRVVRETE